MQHALQVVRQGSAELSILVGRGQSEAKPPGMKELALVATMQLLPGGVEGRPFGTQGTGIGPKSMSGPVPG